MLLLAIAGCSAVQPVAVEPEELHRYWVLESSPTLEMVTFHGPVSACVLVEFTIASSGKPKHVYAARASQTEGPFVEAALAHVRAKRFKPSQGNAARKPVATRKVVLWEWDDDFKNDAALTRCYP